MSMPAYAAIFRSFILASFIYTGIAGRAAPERRGADSAEVKMRRDAQACILRLMILGAMSLAPRRRRRDRHVSRAMHSRRAQHRLSSRMRRRDDLASMHLMMHGGNISLSFAFQRRRR